MEILGLVENMSGLKCPYCGKIIPLFKTRGGEIMAEKENIRLLATLPFEMGKHNPYIAPSQGLAHFEYLQNQQVEGLCFVQFQAQIANMCTA